MSDAPPVRSGWHGHSRRSFGQLLALLALAALARADVALLQWRAMPALPETIGVAAPFVGVSHDTLIVAGGANFSAGLLWEGGVKVWHDEVYALPDAAAKWEVIGRLPRPLAYGVSASHGNSVICVGGSDRQRHHAEAFRIEFRERKIRFHPLPALPQPMANGAGAALNGKLYVVAGTRNPKDSTAMRGFWMLDLQRADAGWRELPVWPGPARIYPVVGVQEGALFLFSGLEISPAATGGVARRHLRDGYRFDLATEVWTRTADLPRPAGDSRYRYPLLLRELPSDRRRLRPHAHQAFRAGFLRPRDLRSRPVARRTRAQRTATAVAVAAIVSRAVVRHQRLAGLTPVCCLERSLATEHRNPSRPSEFGRFPPAQGGATRGRTDGGC